VGTEVLIWCYRGIVAETAETEGAKEKVRGRVVVEETIGDRRVRCFDFGRSASIER